MPKVLSPADIERFRERLIDVAEPLFATHGPDGVTMRQLADALGVSSMTAYRYFEDKDAILAAVRTRAFLRFAEALEAAGAVEPARKAVKGTPYGDAGDAYLAFALDNPAAYRLMFDVHQPTQENYPELVAAMDRARLTMGAGLRQLAAEGKFAGDVELAAHAFWAALHGPVMLQLAGLLSAPIDARRLARTAVDALAQQFGLDDASRKRAR